MTTKNSNKYRVVKCWLKNNDMEKILNDNCADGYKVFQIFLNETEPSMSNGQSHQYFTVIFERAAINV